MKFPYLTGPVLLLGTIAQTTLASEVYAQAIVEVRVVGQPLMYMKAGKLDGCGVRLIVVDAQDSPKSTSPVAVWDMSFNLYVSGHAAVKIGSYDIAASELKSGTVSGKQKNVPTANGWLKARNADATAPLTVIGKSDDAGFILYATEPESVLALMLANMDRKPILIGTRRVGAKGERIFSGTIEMSDGDNAHLDQCLSEYLAATRR